MGTQGMKGSLVSRELITDSIELMARSHMFDGLVVIVGCDKTIPAGAMALARLNLPGLVLYSGSIAPGQVASSGPSCHAGAVVDRLIRLADLILLRGPRPQTRATRRALLQS